LEDDERVAEVVAEALRRGGLLVGLAHPDALDKDGRRRWQEATLGAARELAFFAKFDRPLLDRAWWEVSRHVEKNDLTSQQGLAACIAAKASALHAPGTRGREVALWAESFACQITRPWMADDPAGVRQLYTDARAGLIEYTADELEVALHALPLGVVGTDDPRSANAVAVELVREALEAVRAG
jgi:hypothetical protein